MKQDALLIAGGGIAGLSAALALAQAGRRVQVFEQAPVLGEVGAGLQLSPNAVRVLQSMGLASALKDIAFQPQAIETRHWRNGRQLSSEALGEQALARWGAPYYHIHRADLQQLLAGAVRNHENIRLHLNSLCRDFGQDNDHAWLHTEAAGQVQGAAVIAADGIHSQLRAESFDPTAPRFTGHVAWRLLVPTDALPAGLIAPAASLWMGPGAHFVHYYVRGGSLVNCVCVVEQQGWEEESWTARGKPAQLAEAFAGWHESLQQLIAAAAAGSCHRWALFDRDPMQQFVSGRLALIGDACHPSLPFLAQGAAMAIEDAAVLARCFQAARETATALQHYQRLRAERVARVIRFSRRNGRIYHLRGLPAAIRNLMLISGLVRPGRGMDWLYSDGPE